MRRWLILISILLLAGCSSRQAIEKLSTPADQALAKIYIADLQAGRLDDIEKRLDPSLKTAGVHETLARMTNLLPPGPPTSVKAVGAHKLISPAGTQTNTTLEYQWGDKWVLCNVAVLTSATAQTIVGINVYPQKTSVEDQVRFSLTGKRPAQYLILVGACLAFCLTLVALIGCIRTKGLGRKWLWILFIVFGFGSLSTNWATGAVNFQPIYVSLFSAAAFAPLYGAWTITMSAPIGAAVFLFRRRKMRAARPQDRITPSA